MEIKDEELQNIYNLAKVVVNNFFKNKIMKSYLGFDDYVQECVLFVLKYQENMTKKDLPYAMKFAIINSYKKSTMRKFREDCPYEQYCGLDKIESSDSNLEEKITDKIFIKQLFSFISKNSSRYKTRKIKILYDRFFLGKSQQQIGDELNLTCTRIGVIESDSIKILREAF